MKMSQLFREMLAEEGEKFTEEQLKMADTFTPEVNVIDIPDHAVQKMKDLLRPEMKKLLKTPVQECEKVVKQHQANN